MRCAPRGLIFLGLAVCLTQAAQAEPIYRWVDDQGVVNYASTPPKNPALLRTARTIDVVPAVVVHESADERAARQQREGAALLAEDARLKRQLLEQQIETERARGDALRAQSAAASMRAGCDLQSGACQDDSTQYLVPVGLVRARHFPGERLSHRIVPRPMVSHPVIVAGAHPF